MSPYILRKVRNQSLFSVKNAQTGQIHSQHSTKTNAMNQIKLLNAIDHGFIPQQGGARPQLSSIAKKMLSYLESMYSASYLQQVAKDILKLTGHKSGGAKSSKKASEIATYVISSLGAALAAALALFIISKGGTSNISSPGYDTSSPPSFQDTPKPAPRPSYPALPAPRAETDYDILGLQEGASLPQIKTAYRKMVLKVHPDKGGDPAVFRRVNEAYERLVTLHGGVIRRRVMKYNYY